MSTSRSDGSRSWRCSPRLLVTTNCSPCRPSRAAVPHSPCPLRSHGRPAAPIPTLGGFTIPHSRDWQRCFRSRHGAPYGASGALLIFHLLPESIGAHPGSENRAEVHAAEGGVQP